MVLFEPTGPHPVAAFDLLTEHGRSGVLMRLFYPTVSAGSGSGQVSHPYTDPECVQGALDGIGRGLWLGGLIRWAFSRLSIRCHWKSRLLPASAAAAAGDDKDQLPQRLPVVILSHGLGGNRHLYSSLSLELASHGCLVAAVEHRDGSACATFFTKEDSAELEWLPLVQHDLSDVEFRNTQAVQRARECVLAAEAVTALGREGELALNNRMPGCQETQLLAQLKDRIDEKRVHLMGHSFGGSAALTALSMAPKGLFRTCTLMDCWMLPVDPEHYSGFRLPVLFLNNDRYHWETNAKRLQQVQDGIQDEAMKTCISIRGTNHVAQMDAGHFLWPRLSRSLGMCGQMQPRDGTIITAAICRAFMAKHEDSNLTDAEQKLLSGEDPSCYPGLSWHPDTGRPG